MRPGCSNAASCPPPRSAAPVPSGDQLVGDAFDQRVIEPQLARRQAQASPNGLSVQRSAKARARRVLFGRHARRRAAIGYQRQRSTTAPPSSCSADCSSVQRSPMAFAASMKANAISSAPGLPGSTRRTSLIAPTSWLGALPHRTRPRIRGGDGAPTRPWAAATRARSSASQLLLHDRRQPEPVRALAHQSQQHAPVHSVGAGGPVHRERSSPPPGGSSRSAVVLGQRFSAPSQAAISRRHTAGSCGASAHAAALESTSAYQPSGVISPSVASMMRCISARCGCLKPLVAVGQEAAAQSSRAWSRTTWRRRGSTCSGRTASAPAAAWKRGRECSFRRPT